MAEPRLSDALAKNILLGWPIATSKLWVTELRGTKWLRGQPVNSGTKGPRLSSPGVKLFTTQPDGLYVLFNNTVSCDVVAIEVCGTIQNLNDKRSRYIPASHSVVLNCTAAWLTERVPVQGRNATQPRWQIAGSFDNEPTEAIAVPVRHLRVMYALPNREYRRWCPDHTPAGYEFFCQHSSLDGYNSQKMQTFLRRMSVRAHFLTNR